MDPDYYEAKRQLFYKCSAAVVIVSGALLAATHANGGKPMGLPGILAGVVLVLINGPQR